MMWEDDDDLDEMPEEQTIREFEQMLALNKSKFFDAAQFEEMFDYYLHRNKIKKAEKTLEIGLEQHPYSVELKMRQCQLLIRRNQYEKCLQLLDELDEILGPQADLYMMRGEVFSDMERHAEAAACLEKAAELVENEDVEFLYIDIANEYFNDQKPDEAVHWLLKAIQTNPDLDLAYFELFQIYRTENNPEGAVAIFNDLIDADPYNPRPWYYLALAKLELDKTFASIEALDFALMLLPEYDEARLQKAEILMDKEQYERALEELEILEQRDYRVFYIAYCKGECFEMMGNFDLAKINYKKSIRLNEKYLGPWLGMAIVMAREGRYLEALPYIERSRKLDPDNPDVLLYTGLIYKALGKQRQAEDAYLELVELDSGYDEAWIELADIQYSEGRLSDSAETLLEGLKSNPENTRMMVRLAGYLCLLGNVPMGLEILENALEVNPDGASEFLEYFPALSHHPAILEILANRNA
ncbi:MAG: tetratricopeptide repeat protein [Flavobacteriales bacterium]|nr:tetratricopeptide repeat protein [Flavobacteriales bacterium]MCX7649786.1 tetratricopeptide repeat protein [Flavobacteriales bacterium]MDW8431502.1 tetratricopeptide repeat protein [Flavobacteriales bacterium]